MTEPAPIVMIHGAFCGGWAFDDFRRPFEALGHRVTALDLPGHEAVGRRGVTGQSMADYARHAAAVIAAQPRPPVVIGHSMGGLVSQMAALRSQAAALVLLAPSSPWGVAVSTVEEAMSAISLHMLGPYWALAVEPHYPAARRYLLDRLPREQRRTVFGRMVPESGRALWETLNWWLDPMATTMIPPQGLSLPVLAIAGGADAIHPPVSVRHTAHRLSGRLETFPDMGHWLVGEPGWKDVADLSLGWLAGLELSPAR